MPTTSPARSALLALFFLLLAASAAHAQTGRKRGLVRELLNSGDVVIDLGAKDGVAFGQALSVERDGLRVARLRVEAVRERRATGVLFEVRDEVLVGDHVFLPRPTTAGPVSSANADPTASSSATAAQAPGPAPPPATPITPAAPGQAQPALTPEEVLARLAGAERKPIEHPSAAERAAEANAEAGSSTSGESTANDGSTPYGASGRPRRAGGPNRVSGSLRLGYDVSIDSGGPTDYSNHGPRAGLTLRVDRLADQDLVFRFRGSARLQITDQVDRTGGDLDPQLYLTEASLAWAPEAIPLELEVGRIGLFDAATVGAVDGVRAAIQLGPIRAGAFGGLDPRPDLSDRGRTKLGAYLRLETPPGETWSLDTAVAYARTSTSDGEVERSLVAADARLRLVPFATVYARAEVDLYGQTDNRLDRSNAELTSVYGSLSIRPVDALSVTIALDRRLPFIGTEALQDLDDVVLGLFPDDVLTGFRLDAQYRLPRAFWIRGAVDVRRGGRDMTTFTGQVGWDAVMDRDIWSSVRLQAWDGDLVTGAGGRFSIGTAFGTLFDLDVSYEAARDEYVRTTDVVWRHTIQGDAFFFLGGGWSGSLTTGYDTGDELDRFFASGTITLRF